MLHSQSQPHLLGRNFLGIYESWEENFFVRTMERSRPNLRFAYWPCVCFVPPDLILRAGSYPSGTYPQNVHTLWLTIWMVLHTCSYTFIIGHLFARKSSAELKDSGLNPDYPPPPTSPVGTAPQPSSFTNINLEKCHLVGSMPSRIGPSDLLGWW